MAFMNEREIDVLEAFGGGERLCGQDLKERDARFAKGRLYDVLQSLEERGLLTSEVEPGKRGIPRCVYKITASGKRILRSGVAFRQELIDAKAW